MTGTDDDLTVCILAGGLSRRLRPLTDAMPKCMLPVGDRPFLQWLLEHFGGLGFRRFVLAVSYLWEQVRDYFGDGARFGWRVEYSVEPGPLGTGGAVLWAQPFWGERALVANGDSLLREDWRELVSLHRRRGLPASMALIRQQDCSRFGSVELRDDRVARFVEKRSGAGPGWVNAGVYVLEQAALEGFVRGTSFSLEGQVFPRLAGRIAAYTCRGTFADIGTPEALAEFRKTAGGAQGKGVQP